MAAGAETGSKPLLTATAKARVVSCKGWPRVRGTAENRWGHLSRRSNRASAKLYGSGRRRYWRV